MVKRATLLTALLALIMGLLVGQVPAVATGDPAAASIPEKTTGVTDLHGQRLPRMKARNADLRGAKLHRANLHHANFRGAKLHHAVMHHAVMHHADLRQANLHHADLSNSVLHSADMRRTVLRHADLHHAVLGRSRTEHAIAHHADLRNVSLHHARLHYVNFTGAKLHRSDFTAAAMNRTTFKDAVAHKAQFRGATGRNASFITAKARKAVFVRATLPSAAMNGADLRGSSFRGADLRRADFSAPTGASLAVAGIPSCGSTCTGAGLASTDFTNANLTSADFAGADLSHAVLRGANLTNANFSGADLSGADFTGASWSGATFRGAVTVGTNWGGASAPTTSVNVNFCTAGHTAHTADTALGHGLVLASYSAMSSTGSGTAIIDGPNGVQFEAAFQCDLTQSTVTISQGSLPSIVFPFTLTVTGARGTFTSPLTGLTVDSSSFSGTVIRDKSGKTTWSVHSTMTYTLGSMVMTGSFSAANSREWEVSVHGGTGSLTTSDGTYTADSFTGAIVFTGGALSGEVQLQASGSHAWLSALPASWQKTMTVDVAFSSSGSNTLVSPTVTLMGSKGSGSHVSSITLTASLPPGGPSAWASQGVRFTGSGTVFMRATPVDVSGWYQSTGYQGQSSPRWDIAGRLANVPLDGGATIELGSIEMSSGTPGFVGRAEVQPTTSSSFVFDTTLTYENAGNWVLTASGNGSSNWTPVTGLTIPAQAFQGTISAVGGSVAWQLSIGSQSNPVIWGGLAAGMNLRAWYSVGTACPLADCGTTSGLFLASHDGHLTADDPSFTASTSGALLADGTWATFTTSSLAQKTFTGPQGASIALGAPSMTLWKGSAPHSTVAGVTMPDVNNSGAGLGVQFCGAYSASQIPYIGSVSPTNACVSWSPTGIVFAIPGLNGHASGGTATATGSGNNVSGVSVGNSAFNGLGWTNLSSKPRVSFGSAVLTLRPSTATVTGAVTLPGDVMRALGKPEVAYAVPATATFSDPSWTAEDASFALTATLPLNYTSNGFTLDDLTINIAKSGASFSFGIGVDATYAINGTRAPVTMSLGYASGVLALKLTATGTGSEADGCNCDGVNGVFHTPQDYSYLTDAFMDVPGMHLWSITGQLILAEGEPGFGLGATVYQDPSRMSTIMQGTTWMRGKFYLNVDLLDPCFDFGFTSSDPATYLQVKGGVLRTSTFDISIAPARGCTVGTDVIAGGISVQFNAAFGSAGYFDFALDFDPTAKTFYEKVDVGNVTVGGITFTDGDLIIDLTPSEQDVTFDTNFTLPPSGEFTSDFAVRINSAANMQFDGKVGLSDWDMAGGTFDVQDLSFQMSFDTSVGTFSSNATGHMKFSAKSSIAFTADIEYSNDTLQQFDFDFDYTHGGTGFDYTLDYDANAHSLSGGIDLDYTKGTSHRFCSGCHTYTRHAYMTISLDYYMNTANPSQASLTIAFSGSSSDGDLKVTGSATLSSVPGTDDSASASLHVHIPNLGSWDDSWTW